MICHACQRETNPYGELDPALGVVEKCGYPDCKAPMRRPATPPAPRVQAQPAEVVEPSRARSIASPLFAPTPASAGITSASLVDMMRARLAVVETRLAEMRALVEEEAMLRRMLRAADGQDDNGHAPN